MTTADPISFALKYHVQNAREPQWCEHCEEAWPCVTKMLADSLYSHKCLMERLWWDLANFRNRQQDKRNKKHSPKRSRKK